MGGRAGRRSAHDQAVARRLQVLGAELAAVRASGTSPAGADLTHTRVRPAMPLPTTARPPLTSVVPTSVVPAPGRHAASSGLTLGSAQLAVVVVVVLLGLGIGAWWLLAGGSPEVTVPTPAPASDLVPMSATSAATTAAATGSPSGAGSVTVDVAGEVRRPGIAVLDAGSRVVDALEAAGGARGGVDLTGLNLARVLVDGEQILVGVEPPAGLAATAATAPGASAPVTSLVNLNTADLVALESLPDVGPVTAQAILNWRAEQGPFTSVDQLVDVDGIGEATLAKLAPYVTL